MISLLITLLLAIAAIAGIKLLLSRRSRLFQTTAIMLGIALVVYPSSLPALAAPNLAALGARDETLTEGQKQLEESLKITPGGGHYSGIEYTQRSGPSQRPVSDDTIKESVESLASDEVIVIVNNGAVRLSGRVKDKKVARQLVERTKEIPGVHEITFNLGLDNPAT